MIFLASGLLSASFLSVPSACAALCWPFVVFLFDYGKRRFADLDPSLILLFNIPLSFVVLLLGIERMEIFGGGVEQWDRYCVLWRLTNISTFPLMGKDTL